MALIWDQRTFQNALHLAKIACSYHVNSQATRTTPNHDNKLLLHQQPHTDRPNAFREVTSLRLGVCNMEIAPRNSALRQLLSSRE